MLEDVQSHSAGHSDSADLGVMVDALKVLAHPVRLRILQWLRDPRAEFPIEQGSRIPMSTGSASSRSLTRWGLLSRPYRPSCELWSVRGW